MGFVTSTTEDFSQNVFPLQIKLFVSSETNSLVVKIHEQDNAIDSYKRACSIFNSDSKPLHIWDFSGKLNKIVMNEGLSYPNDSPRQPSREYFLQLQVHGFTDTYKDRDNRGEEMAETDSNDRGSCDGLVRMNGSTDELNFSLTRPNSSQHICSYRGAGSLGLIGLQNLGNTCFMNSAIQCLVHTPELVYYFLGDYCKEINSDNPLGVKGDLAIAFGELLRTLWAPGMSPVAPRMFKQKIANFAPQFSGYNQHDSQEFLSFLLDGLHEDLNRVKCKLATKAEDTAGCPDEEVARDYWKNHLAQNDSIIVDLFHGQYRSAVVCSICKRVSVAFDPFVYLSLPLPSTTMRTMTLTVLSTDGTSPPSTFTITVPKNGRLKDLIDALGVACFLNDDETLLVAEIYKTRIFRILEDLNDSLSLIRNEDCLVAYRLPKGSGVFPLVEFIHQRIEKQFNFGATRSDPTTFGIPFLARLSDLHCGFDLHKHYMRLLNPFSISIAHVSNDFVDNANEDGEIDDATSHTNWSGWPESDSESGDDEDLDIDFRFYFQGELVDKLIEMNEPVLIPQFSEMLKVRVLWSDKMIKKYDISQLSSLPMVFKTQSFFWSPQDSVSLYKCLEEYLKEEPLGLEDMWYCPDCKKHQQANKKIDLWKLPEIIVIHLKRFSYTEFSTSKLESYVDFPIDDMDFSSYFIQKNIRPNRYNLYAIINHYGSTFGGHYTAFVRHNGKWYEFDDDKVHYVTEESIKTSAAYVLFYRRVPDA
ncbi:ubiquitin carboxyl-terminal hydrolase 8 isoform X2 [Morus notabilis]|nr:ubiquitin carboxyl-terminal hydrolase 8 isoform X2 [Morus notabilis]